MFAKMLSFLYLPIAILSILHCTAASFSSQEAPPAKSKSATFLAELILKNDCFANHDSLAAVSICLKTKLLVNLNELLRSNRTIEISGFEFVKTKPLSEVDNSLDERLNEIPDQERSIGNEGSELSRMIFKRVWQFLQTRSVKLNEDSAVDDEGRKKKEKGGQMMMMGAGMMMMMMKMMMYKVSMIAMKALVIGKIALILSGILILKKLMMQQGGGGDHGSSSHGSSDWSSRRIYQEGFGADMAYSGYAPIPH